MPRAISDSSVLMVHVDFVYRKSLRKVFLCFLVRKMTTYYSWPSSSCSGSGKAAYISNYTDFYSRKMSKSNKLNSSDITIPERVILKVNSLNVFPISNSSQNFGCVLRLLESSADSIVLIF